MSAIYHKIERKNMARIYINGKLVDDISGDINVKIENENNIGKIYFNHNMVVEGDIYGDVHAGMNLECRQVNGEASARMNLECGNIFGSASAGMDIKCRSIGGNAKAGMNIKYGHTSKTSSSI
jgi:hypothetical protein